MSTHDFDGSDGGPLPPRMKFKPSPQLGAAALLRGHSIQGGKVFDNLGGLWHEFATHAEAVAAVEAFKHGIEIGKQLGADETRKAIRDVLGVPSDEKVVVRREDVFAALRRIQQ